MVDPDTDVDRQFVELLGTIEKIASVTFGTNEIEPQLTELLRVVVRHPAKADRFSTHFLDLIGRSPPGAVETLEFCMHTLRWESVRQRLIDLRDESSDWGIRQACDRSLAAFADPWENAELYEFYRA